MCYKIEVYTTVCGTAHSLKPYIYVRGFTLFWLTQKIWILLLGRKIFFLGLSILDENTTRGFYRFERNCMHV